jgi:hypothetical protein
MSSAPIRDAASESVPRMAGRPVIRTLVPASNGPPHAPFPACVIPRIELSKTSTTAYRRRGEQFLRGAVPRDTCASRASGSRVHYDLDYTRRFRPAALPGLFFRPILILKPLPCFTLHQLFQKCPLSPAFNSSWLAIAVFPMIPWDSGQIQKGGGHTLDGTVSRRTSTSGREFLETVIDIAAALRT